MCEGCYFKRKVQFLNDDDRFIRIDFACERAARRAVESALGRRLRA